MSIIKMFLPSAGVATALASSIDVPAKGVIRALTLGLLLSADNTPATGDTVQAELSFLSTALFASNDARGSLCQTSVACAFADAARISVTGVPFCVQTPIAVSVAAGERVFLHGQSSQADMAWAAVAYLFIDDGIDVARPQLRRR